MVAFYVSAYESLLKGESIEPEQHFTHAKDFLRKDYPDLVWHCRKKKILKYYRFLICGMPLHLMKMLIRISVIVPFSKFVKR